MRIVASNVNLQMVIFRGQNKTRGEYSLFRGNPIRRSRSANPKGLGNSDWFDYNMMMIFCKFCKKPIASLVNNHKYNSRLDRRIPRPSFFSRRGIKPYGYTCLSCQEEFRAIIENNPEYKAIHDRAIKAIKEGLISKELSWSYAKRA